MNADCKFGITPQCEWLLTCLDVSLLYIQSFYMTLMYCKGDGKVTVTVSKMTFDKHIKILKRYHKGDISYTFHIYQTLMALFPKSNILFCTVLLPGI